MAVVMPIARETVALWMDVDKLSVALDGMDPFKLPPPYDSWQSESITWKDAWNVQSVRKGLHGELRLKSCPKHNGHLPPKLTSLRLSYAGDDSPERMMEMEDEVPESIGKRVVDLELCVRSFGIPRQRFIDGIVPADGLVPWHRDQKRNGSSHYIGTVDDPVNACLYRPPERMEELRCESRFKFPRLPAAWAEGPCEGPSARRWLLRKDLETIGVMEEMLLRVWKVIDPELERMILSAVDDLRGRLKEVKRSEELDREEAPEMEDEGLEALVQRSALEPVQVIRDQHHKDESVGEVIDARLYDLQYGSGVATEKSHVPNYQSCPSCGSWDTRSRGRRRWSCSSCGTWFRPEPKRRGRPPKEYVPI